MVESADKLKISILDNEEVFEKEKNNVEYIHIDKTNKIIEIKFNDDSEWTCKIIPFESIASFVYKRIELNPYTHSEKRYLGD